MLDTRTLLARPQWQCLRGWGALHWGERHTLLICQPVNTSHALLAGTSVSAHASHFLGFLDRARPLTTFRRVCQHFFPIPAAFGPPPVPAVCSPHGVGIPRRQARRHSQRKEEEKEEGGSYCIKHFPTLTQTCGHPHFTGAGPGTPQLQETGTPINKE